MIRVKNYLSSWVIYSLILLSLNSCISIEGTPYSKYIAWLTQNNRIWKLKTAFDNQQVLSPTLIEVVEIKFMEEGDVPSYYQIEPGQIPRPDYNTLMGKGGRWSLDDLNNPTTITFFPSSGYPCSISILNLSENSFTLKWKLPKKDNGSNPGANKLEPAYEYNFILK